LSSWVVDNELERTGDVDLTLLFCNFNLFIGFGNRAVATTILNNFFSRTKEAWMSMKMDLSVVGLVPLCIEKQIFGIEKAIDLGSLVLWA